MTNSKTRVLVESPKLCLGYVGAGLNLDKWPVGKTVCWLACGDLGWNSVISQKTVISDPTPMVTKVLIHLIMIYLA